MTDENQNNIQYNPWKYLAIAACAALGLCITNGYRMITDPSVEYVTGKRPEQTRSMLERAHDRVSELRKKYKTIDDIVPVGVPPNPYKARARGNVVEKTARTQSRVLEDFDGDGVPEQYTAQGSAPRTKEYTIDSRLYPHSGKLTKTEQGNGVIVKTYELDGSQSTNKNFTVHQGTTPHGGRLTKTEQADGVTVKTYEPE